LPVLAYDEHALNDAFDIPLAAETQKSLLETVAPTFPPLPLIEQGEQQNIIEVPALSFWDRKNHFLRQYNNEFLVFLRRVLKREPVSAEFKSWEDLILANISPDASLLKDINRVCIGKQEYGRTSFTLSDSSQWTLRLLLIDSEILWILTESAQSQILSVNSQSNIGSTIVSSSSASEEARYSLAVRRNAKRNCTRRKRKSSSPDIDDPDYDANLVGDNKSVRYLVPIQGHTKKPRTWSQHMMTFVLSSNPSDA